MSYKKEITNPNLSTKEVKKLELDEQPKPIRKDIDNPSIPSPDKAEASKLYGNKKDNRT